MTFEDPVVKEIRRVRNEHALRFNKDLAEIVADIRRLEQESSHQHVNFPPRRSEESGRPVTSR